MNSCIVIDCSTASIKRKHLSILAHARLPCTVKFVHLKLQAQSICFNRIDQSQMRLFCLKICAYIVFIFVHIIVIYFKSPRSEEKTRCSQGLKISPALRRLLPLRSENSNVWKRLDSRTQDAVRDLIHQTEVKRKTLS